MSDTHVKLKAPVLAQANPGAGGGGCLLAFGAPFVAIGAGAAWMRYAHPESIGHNGPAPPAAILYCTGAIFAGGGLLLWMRGLRAIFVSLRTERLMRARPDEPWWGDHRWNAAGTRQHPWLAALGGMAPIAYFALFLSPFHWWMATDPWIPGYFILGVFDLILIALLVVWFYGLLRVARYGASWIRFERFPFFLGETLDVRVGCRRGFAGLDKLTVTVRFVETRAESSDNKANLVGIQKWVEHRDIDPRQLADANEVPISVTLPPGGNDRSTWLSENPPRYWELEMKGEAPGVDFEARFLLPVYAR
jgi:hypothetical protein